MIERPLLDAQTSSLAIAPVGCAKPRSFRPDDRAEWCAGKRLTGGKIF